MDYNSISERQLKEVMAESLTTLYKASGRSYAALAREYGCSKTQMANLINGERNLNFSDWLRMCTLLETTPMRFLSDFEKKLEMG